MKHSVAKSENIHQITLSKSVIDRMENDFLLFQKVKAGDEASFEFLFKKYYARLTHFAYTYVKDSEIAEELVQNAYVKIWENRNKLGEISSFKSYIYQMVRNSGLNHVRNSKNQNHHLTVLNSPKFVTSTAENELNIKDIKFHLFRALEALPPKCKRIFQMSRLEGMKHGEIAQHLNLKTKTIENQIGIALKHLRVELSEYLQCCILLILSIIS